MLEEQKTLSAQEHQQEMEKIELKARLEGQYDVEEAQIKAQTQIITSTDNTPSVT